MQTANQHDPRERMTDNQQNIQADDRQDGASLTTQRNEEREADETLASETDYDDEE